MENVKWVSFSLLPYTLLVRLILYMLVLSCKLIGAGISTIGLTGSGVGLGCVFAGYLIALSRNPSLKQDLFSTFTRV